MSVKSRILAVEPESASAEQKQALDYVQSQYGYLPGIARLLLVEPKIGQPAWDIYGFLNLRPDSPLSKQQREMLSLVVTGLIGACP